MKLQLDTTKKTIKLEEDIKLSLLIDTIKKLLPNNEWKQFTLQTNTTIGYWNSPVIIKEYPSYPQYPWYVKYNSTTGESLKNIGLHNEMMSLKAGVYNVEI